MHALAPGACVSTAHARSARLTCPCPPDTGSAEGRQVSAARAGRGCAQLHRGRGTGRGRGRAHNAGGAAGCGCGRGAVADACNPCAWARHACCAQRRGLPGPAGAVSSCASCVHRGALRSLRRRCAAMKCPARSQVSVVVVVGWGGVGVRMPRGSLERTAGSRGLGNGGRWPARGGVGALAGGRRQMARLGAAGGPCAPAWPEGQGAARTSAPTRGRRIGASRPRPHARPAPAWAAYTRGARAGLRAARSQRVARAGRDAQARMVACSWLGVSAPGGRWAW